ncbi:YgjP-like metallopeptidase domain-containing protein [Thermococcus piezophilus]|uniref:YgjP-like metallopeptidase domain-containing protein n=1 Tax=Thermococcus piezophilus TaxID=1712654 RepID=UPI001F400751|nr:YgjP-like metallopeptidase domain-containing protein [Thermococcus piezophilus]
MDYELCVRPVKYARLEVRLDGRVVVTAPSGFDVDSFIEKHREWLEKKIAEVEKAKNEAELGFPSTADSTTSSMVESRRYTTGSRRSSSLRFPNRWSRSSGSASGRNSTSL